MRKWIPRAVLIAAAVYLVFASAVYSAMASSPGTFNQFMARLPMPAMMLIPFETLWLRARAGALEVGQMAPDFELRRLKGEGKVRLSSHRGQRPVLLVFGSYT